MQFGPVLYYYLNFQSDDELLHSKIQILTKFTRSLEGTYAAK